MVLPTSFHALYLRLSPKLALVGKRFGGLLLHVTSLLVTAIEATPETFGKRHWFRSSSSRRGCLTPITWQGWLYYCIWSMAIAIPASLLILRGQIFESLVWALFTTSIYVLDVRQVRRSTT